MVGFLALGAGGLLQAADDVGTLQFYANGEDFVRQGFTSADGWAIEFEHVYVYLVDVTAYQTDPPYDADLEDELSAQVTVDLAEPVLIDLAEGDEDAESLPVGAVDDVPVGHYNALAWRMVNAPDDEETDSEVEGYTLVMVGIATRDEDMVDFTLRIEAEYGYLCGEYVGDARKGFVLAGEIGDLEMTFHFDHIFGDVTMLADDDLNAGSLGFDPLAALAEDGVVDVDLARLEAALDDEQYTRLVDEILPSLGHAGEAHCYATVVDATE